MNSDSLNQLIEQAMQAISPDHLSQQRKDVEKNLRAALEAGISRLDLVTRDEFDTQQRVLQRTRAKIDQLETTVAELEQALKNQ